jgi:DNA-directed RNA polymerase subunit M/transcription elongation factor TFIIS
MKCPNCGYGAPVTRCKADIDNEWWWLECPKCGYKGHAAMTEEQAKKNWEEDAGW